MGFKKGYIPWNKGKRCPRLRTMLGKKHSLETKRKMSNAHKGQTSWCKGIKLSKELCKKRKVAIIEYYKQGNKSGMFGKRHSEETKIKMSLASKGRKPNYIAQGKENHFWIDGRSKQKGYRSLKARNWQLRNPEKVKLYKQRNRIMRRKLGVITLKTIQLVYEDNVKRFGTLTCYLCLKPIEFGKDQLEHKIPLFRGGTNEYQNLGISCPQCNYKKHIKTEEEYRQAQPHGAA